MNVTPKRISELKQFVRELDAESADLTNTLISYIKKNFERFEFVEVGDTDFTIEDITDIERLYVNVNYGIVKFEMDLFEQACEDRGDDYKIEREKLMNDWLFKIKRIVDYLKTKPIWQILFTNIDDNIETVVYLSRKKQTRYKPILDAMERMDASQLSSILFDC